MDRILSLEYTLSHPYPKGRWFLSATLLIFSLLLPVLILVNLATLGSEQVLSLQTQFQPNKTLLAGWWGTNRLPSQLSPRAPECQMKDIGRGDTFRLSSSLFEYTVMSVLTRLKGTGSDQLPDQTRVEYRGQNFSRCRVNGGQFDFDLLDGTQSVMLDVFCPGFPSPPYNVSMQTSITFATELNRDFVGQYYGPGLDLLNINDTNPQDHRKVVLAVLNVISTDSLAIMRRPRLSNVIGRTRIYFVINATTGAWEDTRFIFTYLNGTQPETYPSEAGIYSSSISNLMNVVMDAVYLDLGYLKFPNLFQNATRMGRSISPNLAPVGINSSDWAEGTQTFYYGALPARYQTWADALLDGYPVQVGGITGLPDGGSTMYTTYVCPSYQVKPMGSLISSVFVGSATMFYSAWGAWMFLTGFFARRIMEPRVECLCDECRNRREEERRKAEETPRNRPVSGMVARLMSMGHRRYTNETNDEEHDHVKPESTEPNGQSDSLAVDYISYTKESTTKQK